MADRRPVLNAERARAVAEELAGIWEEMTGRPTGALTADLERLADWFHPKREPGKLLERMEDAPTRAISDDVDPSFVARLGDHVFVTPEGRLAVDRLRAAARARRSVTVRPEPTEALVLLDLYRGWARYRFEGFAAKVEGRADPPSLVAIGAALLVAACDWTSEERAVVVPAEHDDRLAIALRRCIEAFADAFDVEPRTQERRTAHFDGYPTQHAQVRLAGALRRRRIDRRGPMHIWLDGDKRRWAVERCAQDLRRRSTGAAATTAVRALEAMLQEVDRQAGAFADAEVTLPPAAELQAFAIYAAAIFEEAAALD